MPNTVIRRLERVCRELPVRVILVAAIAITVTQNARAGFIDYIIRGTPTINTLAADEYEFIVSESGQKAGLGSSDIDGVLLGDLTSVSIDRLDDRTRFAAGSGPYVAPYLNFWITDGSGHFAVAANEPSDPAFQPLYNNGYSLTFADLSNKVAKIYENSNKSWLPNNGIGLTFQDLAGFTIMAPSVSQLAAGWDGLGPGAPRELGTNQAYGVNWIFGDTLTNYVSGASGYVVADAGVVGPTPEPSTFALAFIAVGGLVFRLRRRA